MNEQLGQDPDPRWPSRLHYRQINRAAHKRMREAEQLTPPSQESREAIAAAWAEYQRIDVQALQEYEAALREHGANL